MKRYGLFWIVELEGNMGVEYQVRKIKALKIYYYGESLLSYEET